MRGAISDGRPYRDKLGALEVAFLELLDEVMKSFCGPQALVAIRAMFDVQHLALTARI